MSFLAPCGHHGEPIIGTYIKCLEGCDSKPAAFRSDIAALEEAIEEVRAEAKHPTFSIVGHTCQPGAWSFDPFVNAPIPILNGGGGSGGIVGILEMAPDWLEEMTGIGKIPYDASNIALPNDDDDCGLRTTIVAKQRMGDVHMLSYDPLTGIMRWL